MRWRWNSSAHPISDIRDWNNVKRLEIRPDFQRQEVWSSAANILLMDTILKNIPMPKIFFKALIRATDTYRIIIDGQQRIKAILSFLNDGFELTEPYNGEYFGKKFSELPKEIQEDFLSYKIDINEIRNASDEIVREIYSRVNKYNIALNKQELRRADYPGAFLKLSEELSQIEFFDKAKIFTIANRKRMGDVEYISELLAVLLSGPQDKKKSLDNFYLKYSAWDDESVNQIKNRFNTIVMDIDTIFLKCEDYISKTRFRKKADFYSLFAAINELHCEGYFLNENTNLNDLANDFEMLHNNILPESGVELFSEYAIKCVSQGNTLNSRIWRKEFLKRILHGTYIGMHDDTTIEQFHKILWDLYTSETEVGCPVYEQECPVCNEEIGNYKKDNARIVWLKTDENFQLSNAWFVHLDCLDKEEDLFHSRIDPNQLKLPFAKKEK